MSNDPCTNILGPTPFMQYKIKKILTHFNILILNYSSKPKMTHLKLKRRDLFFRLFPLNCFIIIKYYQLWIQVVLLCKKLLSNIILLVIFRNRLYFEFIKLKCSLFQSFNVLCCIHKIIQSDNDEGTNKKRNWMKKSSLLLLVLTSMITRLFNIFSRLKYSYFQIVTIRQFILAQTILKKNPDNQF